MLCHLDDLQIFTPILLLALQFVDSVICSAEVWCNVMFGFALIHCASGVFKKMFAYLL